MGADPQAVEPGTRVGITFTGAGTLDGVVAAVGDGCGTSTSRARNAGRKARSRPCSGATS